MIEVVEGGPLTTVQDLGRPGLAHLGVGRSGAADRPSLALANRLVGNDEDAACLEATYGGLVVRFEHAATIAVTGAPCPVRVAGSGRGTHGPLQVAAGDVVELGTPPAGLRTYVAVRGGIDVPPVLGSRSTDTLAHLGPSPVTAGTRLVVGEPRHPVPGVDLAPAPRLDDTVVLDASAGPRHDWFNPEAHHVLATSTYEVTADADRVGVRLSGPGLERTITGELPSEGMVEGAVQVPPDGRPVVFLADHPVTGGYPVVAVVDVAAIPLLAQARPGQAVRFRVR